MALTFLFDGATGITCTGGSLPVVAFPASPVEGAVTLLSSPEQTPRQRIMSWPGEYDVAGISIRGIGHDEGKQVSFVVEIDHVRIAFPCSPLAEWGDEDIEHLGDVSVLVLPADDVKRSQKLLDDIDPRVLLLVPAADGTIHADVLKACGATGVEPVVEYKLKGQLPAEGRETVVFG